MWLGFEKSSLYVGTWKAISVTTREYHWISFVHWSCAVDPFRRCGGADGVPMWVRLGGKSWLRIIWGIRIFVLAWLKIILSTCCYPSHYVEKLQSCRPRSQRTVRTVFCRWTPITMAQCRGNVSLTSQYLIKSRGIQWHCMRLWWYPRSEHHSIRSGFWWSCICLCTTASRLERRV